MSNLLPQGVTEKTFGRVLKDLRWHEGRLQGLYSEKYEQYEGRRYLAGGTRERWQDIPGEPPAPPQAAGVEVLRDSGVEEKTRPAAPNPS